MQINNVLIRKPLINANTKDANDGLVYPELSYQIMGILYKIHNELGAHLQEKYYQRAIEEELTMQKIPFEREKMIPLTYINKTIGRYFVDFIIDSKIALEIKSIDFFTKKEWKQVTAYLKTANLRLGILANFSQEKIIYKRVLNKYANEC